MVHMVGWGVEEQGWRKGPWTAEEDKLLSHYVSSHGEGRWSSVARSAGLNRSGKSCRLRWVNYLKPGLKRSQLTPQEEGIIIELHALWGNKWSTIARYLPGRTDNEIKNYWRTHFKKKEKFSKKQEKRKAQLGILMSKQQPQPQQQHHHHHQQQQQQDGTKKVLFHTGAEFNTKLMNEQQGIQQQTAVFTCAASEDQCWNPMYQQETAASWYPMGDDIFWDIGGLWNLDDDESHRHHNNSTGGCSKIGMHFQADHTFYCGGVGGTNIGGYKFK